MKSYDILLKIADEYKKLDGVEAIVLGGSSSAKTADERSDFDVYIYCTKEPDVKKRREIAKKYADNLEIDNHYFETGDVYVLRETKKPVDVMYRSFEMIEGNLRRVLIDCGASLGYTTCFAHNVNKSEILFDPKGAFKKLQNLTKKPYPEKLAENIIEKNFSYLKDVMFSYYDQLESAVLRSDFVSVNHRSAAFLASYFDVIFAKNKIYNPGEKKLVSFALKNCEILPKDFEKDVNEFAAGEVETKLETAKRLVENLRVII